MHSHFIDNHPPSSNKMNNSNIMNQSRESYITNKKSKMTSQYSENVYQDVLSEKDE